jgi:hypothetical protein
LYPGKQILAGAKMPYVDPEFVVPIIPEDEMYEGTEVDKNVLGGEHSVWKTPPSRRIRNTERWKLFH